MMPQLVSEVAVSNEQAIAQAELEQYVTQQASAVAPFDLRAPLSDATQDILRHAPFGEIQKLR